MEALDGYLQGKDSLLALDAPQARFGWLGAELIARGFEAETLASQGRYSLALYRRGASDRAAAHRVGFAHRDRDDPTVQAGR